MVDLFIYFFFHSYLLVNPWIFTTIPQGGFFNISQDVESDVVRIDSLMNSMDDDDDDDNDVEDDVEDMVKYQILDNIINIIYVANQVSYN